MAAFLEELPRPESALPCVVLEKAGALASRGVRGALATVVQRYGSAPSTPGQKIYLGEDGTCLGTVGGGAVERETLRHLVRTMEDLSAPCVLHTFALGASLGMCCGGRVEMLIEPVEALVSCLIVGGGHVASATAPLLVRVGFSVTVADARGGWAAPGRLGEVRMVEGDATDVANPDPRGACLVMTHDHALDQAAIEWAMERGFAFVGGIGSRAKAERTRQRLEARGVSKEDCARVRMPLGLDIRARTPEEIAIAVTAELVAWKNKRGVR